MPQILESDQTRVQVFMHDHTVSHLLGVGSEGYQQNARFEKSPELAPLSSPSGLVECLILLLQTSNPLRLGEDYFLQMQPIQLLACQHNCLTRFLSA